MRKVFLPVIILMLISVSQVLAQYNTPQNKRWVFGYYAGLDFTSGSPTAFTSSIYANEGTASVSDAAGNLLFYTDGTKVWNRTGTLMPSGSAIVSYLTSSATQGSLIAPVIGSTTQYYIFSLEQIEGGSGTGHCRLSYSVVDMTLAGGMGDVVAASMGTYLTNELGEKMCAVAGTNCDVWVLVHRRDSTKFLAYDITAAGVAGPIVSSVGTLTAGGYGSYCIGEMKASPNGLKIVTGSHNYTAGTMGAELYDFNPSTGIVSNCLVLDSLNGVYGAEFSPNNSKLYITSNTNIVQYDLSAGSGAAILASAYTAGSLSFSALKLGPDGKIYFSMTVSGSVLGSINSPNTAGSGCSYSSSTVSLASGSSIWIQFSNTFIGSGTGGDTSFFRHDTMACLPVGTSLSLAVPPSGATSTSYIWDNGTTGPTRTITSVGTYWAISDTGGCHKQIDTFVVTTPPTTINTQSRDTSICASVPTFTLTAPAGYTTYSWSTGASGPTITPSASGAYYVYCSIGCTTLIDTINVTTIPYLVTNTTRDTSFCFPGSLLLTAVQGFSSYIWQDGTVGGAFTANAAGTYWVTYSGSCDSHTDTVHIIQAPLIVDLGPDVSVCMNYTIVPSITGKDVSYLWQDGSTGSTYSASRTGTYSVTVKMGGCVATDVVKVNFIHLSQNLPDTFICKGTPIELSLNATLPAGGSVVWENGSTNPSRVVRDSGTYWVYVKQNECEILDTVRVVTGYCDCWYDVPTAFTPNADGLNDIIRPNIQPGCSISGYQFSVFNRWGELMYTTSTPGNGWDGMYKGVPVDMGVYYYALNLFVGIHNKSTKHNGNFTLIR